MLIEEIDGVPPATHRNREVSLPNAGFISGALGMQAKLHHTSSSIRRSSVFPSQVASHPSGVRQSSVEVICLQSLSHDDFSNIDVETEDGLNLTTDD
jgi:hypothetical protein